MKKPFPIPVRVRYNCLKCPGYCCTYSDIEVTDRDIARLGKHFGLGPKEAEAKFTKLDDAKTAKILRHKKDTIFDSACMFFDQEKRRCTVYEVRPGVCRKYPAATNCGYYDFLRFERNQQDDKDYVALT
ncbi:zinc/iron-chelating domain-containing protein [Betaproteobacteria bacterium GR16-43]|nr:zinc/iron-chelating domain-containing protein [Betaproteobacteria bacterium GR16-43]